MLEDRDYMRQPEFQEPRWTPPSVRGWPLTVWFLITYALVFILQWVFSRTVPGSGEMMEKYFALSNEGLAHGYIWQLVTYQFMHASVAHIVLNCFAIYSFGVEVERMLGARRFAALMFSSGIVGGIVQSFAAFIWPDYFGHAPVVGASASAFGLVATFALLLPHQEITMYVLYIIPVTMRAKTLLYVLGGMALAGFSFPGLANKLLGPVAHCAHLGGMVTGIFFAEKIVRGNWLQRPPEAVAENRVPAAVEKPPAADLSMQEVDAILDKISARGIGSLTAREREQLEKARQRMKGS